MESLSLAREPLTFPPQHVIQRRDDGKTVVQFFRDLAQGAECLSRVRVMLVGHGAAGKSTIDRIVFQRRPVLSVGMQSRRLSFVLFACNSQCLIFLFFNAFPLSCLFCRCGQLEPRPCARNLQSPQLGSLYHRCHVRRTDHGIGFAQLHQAHLATVACRYRIDSRPS